MADKLFVSDYTHRTESEQLKKLYENPDLKGAPIFRPEDLSAMFRSTRRTESDTYHAASVACLAPDKKRLEEFISGCQKRKACIVGKEEELVWTPNQLIKILVDAWKLARINGAAAVGGQNTAKAWKAKMKAGVDKAATLWGLPSKKYSIKDVEAISGISRGAIVKELGNRFVAQYNYQAAQKRKERRNAKTN